MEEFEEKYNNIDTMNVVDSDYVIDYYSLIFDFFRVHRDILHNDLNKNTIRNSIIEDDIVERNIFNLKNELLINTRYNLLLSKSLNIMSDYNYKDIYKIGMIIYTNYIDNINYFNGLMFSNNMKRKEINYIGVGENNYFSFCDFFDKKYKELKLRR